MRFLGRQLRIGSTAPAAGAVLGPGTPVETPEGPGVVERVELALIPVGTRVELDVPQIWVKLQRSLEVKKICLCKISVGDPAATAALHDEFHRLWPPLPPDAELPPALSTALLTATGRLATTPEGAAHALSLYANPVALLRSATTAAVLSQPDQRRCVEAAEAAVLRHLENTHA